MTTWIRFVLTVTLSLIAWVPFTIFLSDETPVLEGSARALIAAGAAVQIGAILVAPIMIAGVLRWTPGRSKRVVQVSGWIAFAVSLPLAWVFRAIAGSLWTYETSLSEETARTLLVDVLARTMMPVTFVLLSLILVLIPIRCPQVRAVLGTTLAVTAILLAAASPSQPGPVGFATAYALLVNIAIARSSRAASVG